MRHHWKDKNCSFHIIDTNHNPALTQPHRNHVSSDADSPRVNNTTTNGHLVPTPCTIRNGQIPQILLIYQLLTETGT
jgi:hypothetical protein